MIEHGQRWQAGWDLETDFGGDAVSWEDKDSGYLEKAVRWDRGRNSTGGGSETRVRGVPGKENGNGDGRSL